MNICSYIRNKVREIIMKTEDHSFLKSETIENVSRVCDILPPPTLRLEVGASRVIPSHDGKLTERSPCAPRFEDKLDDRQSFHALMFDIDGRIDVPVALESTFTAECPFRKR